MAGCGKPSRGMALVGASQAAEGAGKGRPAAREALAHPDRTFLSSQPCALTLAPRTARQALEASSPFSCSSQPDRKLPTGKGATGVTVALLSWAHGQQEPGSASSAGYHASCGDGLALCTCFFSSEGRLTVSPTYLPESSTELTRSLVQQACINSLLHTTCCAESSTRKIWIWKRKREGPIQAKKKKKSLWCQRFLYALMPLTELRTHP